MDKRIAMMGLTFHKQSINTKTMSNLIERHQYIK